MKDKSMESMEEALAKANTESMETNVQEPMPEPEIKNYEPSFKMSDKFIDDVNKILGEFPYAQTQAIMKAIDGNREKVGVQLLNQIIQAITQFPYRAVKPIMEIIESQNQSEYWTPVE